MLTALRVQVASNRYATHLAACMGVGNRRGAARNASVKSKCVLYWDASMLFAAAGRSDAPRRLGNDDAKVGSPRLASEVGDAPEEVVKPAPKGKGKGKAKKVGELVCVCHSPRVYIEDFVRRCCFPQL